MQPSFKILMILTSQATMGARSTQATGVWFEEVATPYYAFVDAGIAVEMASVAGGAVPIDPHSLQAPGQNPASVERFLQDAHAMQQLQHSQPLQDLTPAPYAAVFLPGGHGTMWDLPQNDALADLLSQAWTDGKVLAAVCHGPAGLLQARDAQGHSVLAGRRVSAFTNSEEQAAGLSQTVPFLLESRIRALGARYERGPDFLPHAVRDGQLVTGQNPASSAAVAALTLEAIGATAAAAAAADSSELPR